MISRVLEPHAFHDWLRGFLPSAKDGQPPTLFTATTVTDRTDGHIAHLDGLNLSRAWCWRLIADRLCERAWPIIESTIEQHLASALDHVTGDYMGEHWLASFALLALDPYPD